MIHLDGGGHDRVMIFWINDCMVGRLGNRGGGCSIPWVILLLAFGLYKRILASIAFKIIPDLSTFPSIKMCHVHAT
jgi:hypothetical protein